MKFLSFEIKATVIDKEHMLKFLKEMEKIERIIRIEQLAIDQPSEEQVMKEKEKEVYVTLELMTFYYVDEEGQ